MSRDSRKSPPEETTPEPGESPPEEPRLAMGLPSWKTPPADQLGSLPSDASLGDRTDVGDLAGAGSPEPSDEPLEKPSTRSGQSRTSSRGATTKRSIRKAIAGGIEAVTGFAHQRLTDPAGYQAGLFLADGEDVADMSGPAAELVHRRVPDLAVTDDVNDGLALGFAIVAYVSKQVTVWAEARQLRAQGLYADAERQAEEQLGEELEEPEPAAPPPPDLTDTPFGPRPFTGRPIRDVPQA